ncbi:hypothetical protein [Bacillus mycoides]|uniref:hypothetical protein n=1 Tax=Bacillus mycoides TaxID=1405 RepID=UPI001485845F|nr:hypothetical protein [Bacillus mycoides]
MIQQHLNPISIDRSVKKFVYESKIDFIIACAQDGSSYQDTMYNDYVAMKAH